MICQQDADQSIFSPLRCPDCGSDDVVCRSSINEHVHCCNDCGRLDAFVRRIR